MAHHLESVCEIDTVNCRQVEQTAVYYESK